MEFNNVSFSANLPACIMPEEKRIPHKLLEPVSSDLSDYFSAKGSGINISLYMEI